MSSVVAVAIGPKPDSGPTAGTAPTGAARPSTTLGPELLALDAGEQYRFAFDMNACIGCHSCEVACAEQNGLPPGTVWRRVGELEAGEHPVTRRHHLSMSCNHCLEPACLQGCPTNAYTKLADGIVTHHADDCIGCQYCTWNCPYSVPVFQPDRRIVTKCDLCRPRLGAGLAPACVAACPTSAITVEKVDTAAWRAAHTAADGPGLPDSGLTLSTTRIVPPIDLPDGLAAASDWTIRPAHAHWSLVWLTLVSQLAVGTVVAAGTTAERLAGSVAAGAALLGALFHLGRPAMAYKALRNLRRSWLSREVALLSLFGALAPLAVVVPVVRPFAAAVGLAAVYASARLYLVPGRPAWDSPLTVLRFVATTASLGAAVSGSGPAVAAAVTVGAAATLANWWRLARRHDSAGQGALRLELHWFRTATVARFGIGAAAVLAALAGVPPAATFGLVVATELLARWLFYVCVVPLDMPGAFWRGTAGSHR